MSQLPASLSALELVREMRALTPNEFRRITVTLMDGASPTVAGVGNGDFYQVPTTHRFLLTGIRGMVELRDLGNELTEAAPLDFAREIEARMLARALRTTVKIWNKDRTENITEEHGVVLAGICPTTGGKPLDFTGLPHIVMPGESISMEVTYYGQGPAHLINGLAGTIPYDCGVILDGILVPKDVLPQRNDLGGIYSFLQDMQKMSPVSYRRSVITLESKPPADLSEKAEVTWRAPGTHNFLIFGIRGHLTFDKLESENAVGVEPLQYSASVKQRAMIRALRTMVQLRVTDNGNDREIIKGDAKQTNTNGGGVTLASIFPPVNGVAIDWSQAPCIIPANEILKMNLAWNGTRSAFETGADYANNNRFGLSLDGILVRTRGD
jgi:hypothetical protein